MLIETKSAKGAATRDQILDAAARLIHLQGYHCTSLDDVLRESGVGKGNFYYHFKSKEDLCYAIIDRLVRGFLERTLEPAFADPDRDPVAQIHGLHEVFRQRLAEIFVQWRAALARTLRRGQASGRLNADCNPEGAAHFLVASLEGAILMSKVTKDITVMEQCVDELKRHLTLYSRS